MVRRKVRALVTTENEMNLKQMAEECELGYLMNEDDEFFVGAQLIALAGMISAAEREAIRDEYRLKLREGKVQNES